jgi:RNA polymerase sigma factor (sigma-70 family)
MSAPIAPTAPPRQSFETVYTERWSRMVRLATLTTGSVTLAEEIVQDAFVQLHQNWKTVQQPVPWLRDWVRRQGVERRHAQPSPELVDADEGIGMRDALNALTPRQRAAIVLRFYEDLSEADIAILLDCRPGTVKSLLARGLRILRKDLERDPYR